MNFEPYILIGLSGLLFLVVGLILLFVWNRMKMRQQGKMKAFLSRDLLLRVKGAVLEALSEGMDLMPEKIMEVKRTIDEG